MMLRKLQNHFWEDRFVYVVLVLGFLSWAGVMVRSGLSYDYGLGFWGPNGHDGVWHIALAESLSRGSLEMPVFWGARLMNYHVGFDLLVAVLHRVTLIPISIIYFQLIPLLMAVSIGFLVKLLVGRIGCTRRQRAWSLFFVYFGGSFGWIVTFFREGKIGGESMFWSQQAVSTLINPPFALSIVVLLSGLLVLDKYLEKAKPRDFWLAVVLFGVLIQIKAYAGVLGLGSLAVSGSYRFWRERRVDLLKVFAGAVVLAVLLFIPLNSASSGLLVFKPFWFLETMLQLTDRVGWVRYGEAMVNYKYGNVWWKAVPAYGLAFLIFWYGNVGSRFLGEIRMAKWVKEYRSLGWIEVFMASVIFGGILAPMLFLQSGTPWNTIQFFYYSLFFLGIAAGISAGGWLKKDTLKNRLVAGAIVVLTLPTTFGTLRNDYLTDRPPAMLPADEVEALEFLSRQPRGVVLTYPFDSALAKEAESNPPRPLYLYVSTAYVSAFSKKQVFLEDEMNLDITGYSWGERKNEVMKFYESLDQEFVREFLSRNNISYIYWVKPQRARLGETQLGIERIFENVSVDIYKVIK